MWKTPEKCGKLQKNVENVWKSALKMWKCGKLQKNVENMWKTHLQVQICDFGANYTTVSRIFFCFLFFCFLFFFFYFFRVQVREQVHMCMSAVLFNYIFLHVARNVREERAGVPVYLSIRNVCEHLYLILQLFVYTSVYCFSSLGGQSRQL